MRQKGILLAFVESVYLIYKHDGAPLLQPVTRCFCLLHGLANILHAAQHSADGDELRVKRIGHQPRNGRLACARRAPQDAAVRLARLKRNAQRHALAQQMLLPDHLAQGLGTQAFGQGLMALEGWLHWAILWLTA